MKLLKLIKEYKSAVAAAEKKLQLHCTKVYLYGDFVQLNDRVQMLECGSVNEPTILVVDSNDPQEIHYLLKKIMKNKEDSYGFNIKGKSYFS